MQIAGDGPDVLLLHGAGASAHSFHRLMPALAGYRLIVPDLPGQGFTRAGGHMRLGLEPMAQDLAALCADQGWAPAAVIGHSAGAAIALRLARILPQPPRAVVGINAALSPFGGVAGWLFPRLARALATSPFVAGAVARVSGAPGQVARLLGGMGSTLDTECVALYRRLVARRPHVDGTLGMMAQWQLAPLLDSLPGLDLPVLLIAAARDTAVPPRVAMDAAARLPQARVVTLPRLGHLAHEEAPDAVATELVPFLTTHCPATAAPGP